MGQALGAVKAEEGLRLPLAASSQRLFESSRRGPGHAWRRGRAAWARRLRAALVAGSAVLAGPGLPDAVAARSDDTPPPAPLAFVQVPLDAQGHAGGHLGDSILAARSPRGGRLMLASLPDVAGSLRPIAGGLAVAADPAFNHDGSRLVFAGQRDADGPMQIWERTPDGRVRQLLACAADCLGPEYLPDGGVVFASNLAGEYEEHGGRRSFSLYALEPGERHPRRLTFNPSSDFDPAVLPDGRIAYSAWQHVGNHFWPRGNVALLLINADGTGLFPLTGNHRGPWLKRGVAPAGGDRLAFLTADRMERFGSGSLRTCSLNDAFGTYDTWPALEGYDVADVVALPDRRLLVSARPTDGSKPSFGLYTVEGQSVTELFDDPRHDDVAPALGVAVPRPERRPSTVVPETPFGYVMVLDCTETDRLPPGELLPGSVASVRVIEGLPLTDAGGDVQFIPSPHGPDEPMIHAASAVGAIPSRILGEVTPASDGSIYVKVPADRPLRVQLLDEDGMALVNERAWFWVRPNERRVCIGCHENRELAPRNLKPLAGASDPVDLTDPTGWRTVTFLRDLQPVISSTCARSGCHVPPTPTAGMNLSQLLMPDGGDAPLADRFGPAYANLLARQDGKPFAVGGRRVHPGASRASPLLWMLSGRPLAPQYGPAPFERPMLEPHPEPPGLTEELLSLFRQWVDLGALYDDSALHDLRPLDVTSAPVEEEDRRGP